MRIFHDLDIAEHNGHGIPTVLKSYDASIFDMHDDYINVVIPFNKEVLENHGTLNEKEILVLNAVLENGFYVKAYCLCP